MLFSNCNAQDVVTEKMNDYLSDNELSFKELKAYLISKSPIPEVHGECVKFINSAAHAERDKVKKVLETQAFKTQVAEDEKQIQNDAKEKTKDEEQKKRLLKEIDEYPELLLKLENECSLLHRKLARLLNLPVVTKKTKNKSTRRDEDVQEIDRLRASITQRQIKMATLTRTHLSNEAKLQEIDAHEYKRNNHKFDIERRAQASAGYKTTGERVEDTLSDKAQEKLRKSIRDQEQALELKYAQLIKDAETINYAFFLGLMPNHLKDFKLTSAENEAINHIIKLMKHHLQYDQKAISIEDSLNKKIASLESQNKKLHQMNLKLDNLQNNNPQLEASNKQLLQQNLDLADTAEQNLQSRKKLTLPALLLLTLTCLSVVPLILTLSGVIPLFLAPIFVYLIVSAPPASLMLATIALGIAALVYWGKQRSNESSIQSNLNTIQTNTNQVKRNNSHLLSLQNQTIPALELQIKKDEMTKDGLIKSLEEAKKLTEDSLKQVYDIEPISFATSTILAKVPSSSDLSGDESDVAEDEVSEEPALT